jgi:type II secretory pathway component PulM
MQETGLDNAEVIAWICFGLGAIVLLVGLYIGLVTAPAKAQESSKEKLDEAKASIAETTATLEAATAGGAETAVPGAAESAKETAQAAKSALEQVGGVVGSLPEHQRFPGMLVLIGAVLMSVGTIQFGGTSIF